MFIYLGLKNRLVKMLEHPDLSRHLRLPAAPGRQPTADDPCSSLYESVGWWEGVHAQDNGGVSFGSNNRNIVLSLGVDAFQPHQRGGLSIVPFLCQVLNLPEDLRHQPQNIILAGVVPGKKARTKHTGPALSNLNTYLAMLVDELLSMYRDGFFYTCPIDQQKYHVRVKLLFTVCDYPGHAKMNCQQHQGAYFGCQKCDIRGVLVGKTMVYQHFNSLYQGEVQAARPQGLTHAEYLRRNEELTTAKQKEAACDKDVVEQRREEEWTRMLYGRLAGTEAKHARDDAARLKMDVAVAKADVQAKEQAMRSVKGQSELCRLPYFDIVEHTKLDMMHIVSGIIGAHVVKMVKGQRIQKLAAARAKQAAKKKPPPAAAAAAAAADDNDAYFDSDDEECKSPPRGRQPAHVEEASTIVAEHEEDSDSQADESDDDFESVDEAAPAVADPAAVSQAAREAQAEQVQRFTDMYHIQAKCLQALEDKAYAKIQSPGGVAPAAKHPFTKTGEMTAHHWVNFSRCYGKYLFQQEYERDEKKYYSAAEQSPAAPARAPRLGLTTLCHLLDFIALCLTSDVTVAVKQRLKDQLPLVAEHVDQYLPPNEHAIVLHLLLFHMPDTIRRWGPVRSYWCFPFERSDHTASCRRHRRAARPWSAVR